MLVRWQNGGKEEFNKSARQVFSIPEVSLSIMPLAHLLCSETSNVAIQHQVTLLSNSQISNLELFWTKEKNFVVDNPTFSFSKLTITNTCHPLLKQTIGSQWYFLASSISNISHELSFALQTEMEIIFYQQLSCFLVTAE